MRALSKKLGTAGLVFTTLVCLAVAPGTGSPAEKQAVRLPAVAGAFYPANAGELANMVDGFLAAAKVPEVKEPVALVVPHAGYIY